MGETDTSDGMDVCLCMIEKSRNKITFAGAKRPLYYIKNTELIEFKGDKKPIGGRQREGKRIFKNKEFTILKGSMLYLTTDGFADQSNPNGDKFGSKRLKKLLLNIHKYSLDKQEKALIKDLDSFQNGEPQRDDILVMGVRL